MHMCYIIYVQSIWMCHPTYYTYLFIYFTARDQRINKFLLNLLWKKLIANTIDVKLHVFYNNFNCPISAGGSLIVNLIGLGKGTSVWQVIFFTREHGLPCVMPDFVFIFICTAIYFNFLREAHNQSMPHRHPIVCMYFCWVDDDTLIWLYFYCAILLVCVQQVFAVIKRYYLSGISGVSFFSFSFFWYLCQFLYFFNWLMSHVFAAYM